MKNLRWNQIDSENQENELIARSALFQWARSMGMRLREDILCQTSRAMVRVALGADPADLTATMVRLLLVGSENHFQHIDCDEWGKISPAMFRAMRSLRIDVPHRSRLHLVRWDARRRYEHRRACHVGS